MKIILNIIAVVLILAITGCSTTTPVDQQTTVAVDESSQAEAQPASAVETETTKIEPVAAEEETEEVNDKQPAWTPEITPRPWSEHHAYFAGLDVEHYPVYMTDPYCLTDSEDGYFKTWDADSALDTVTGPAIFIGNVIALPVAAAFDPPWQTQTSRGQFPITEPAHEIPMELSGMVENESDLDE